MTQRLKVRSKFHRNTWAAISQALQTVLLYVRIVSTLLTSMGAGNPVTSTKNESTRAVESSKPNEESVDEMAENEDGDGLNPS